MFIFIQQTFTIMLMLILIQHTRTCAMLCTILCLYLVNIHVLCYVQYYVYIQLAYMYYVMYNTLFIFS